MGWNDADLPYLVPGFLAYAQHPLFWMLSCPLSRPDGGVRAPASALSSLARRAQLQAAAMRHGLARGSSLNAPKRFRAHIAALRSHSSLCWSSRARTRRTMVAS